jgi:hypothetical protein
MRKSAEHFYTFLRHRFNLSLSLATPTSSRSLQQQLSALVERAAEQIRWGGWVWAVEISCCSGRCKRWFLTTYIHTGGCSGSISSAELPHTGQPL